MAKIAFRIVFMLTQNGMSQSNKLWMKRSFEKENRSHKYAYYAFAKLIGHSTINSTQN